MERARDLLQDRDTALGDVDTINKTRFADAEKARAEVESIGRELRKLRGGGDSDDSSAVNKRARKG